MWYHAQCLTQPALCAGHGPDTVNLFCQLYDKQKWTVNPVSPACSKAVPAFFHNRSRQQSRNHIRLRPHGCSATCSERRYCSCCGRTQQECRFAHGGREESDWADFIVLRSRPQDRPRRDWQRLNDSLHRLYRQGLSTVAGIALWPRRTTLSGCREIFWGEPLAR